MCNVLLPDITECSKVLKYHVHDCSLENGRILKLTEKRWYKISGLIVFTVKYSYTFLIINFKPLSVTVVELLLSN